MQAIALSLIPEEDADQMKKEATLLRLSLLFMGFLRKRCQVCTHVLITNSLPISSNLWTVAVWWSSVESGGRGGKDRLPSGS